MSYADLIFLEGPQLIEAMERCQEEPDRAEAHEVADRILCAALHKASAGELTETEAISIISAYFSVERWYG